MNQEKIGKFIQEKRKEKNLTQEQLAEKMGVSINAVSKWERGLSFPDVSLLKKLCQELNISIEELINGEKDTSNEAREKAIIKVVQAKNKTKRKLRKTIAFSVIIIILIIIISVFFYKDKNSELEEYYERNYQMSLVARNVEAYFKYRYDKKYPDYYGGMYISNDANYLIIQIVKDNIPESDTIDFYYYNELFTVDKAIKVEYVNNSYNDLEKVYNTIIDYLKNNKPMEDFNSVYIDVYQNSVVVNYVDVSEKIKKEFKEKVIDSNLVIFESALKNIDDSIKCVNYPKEIGDDILSQSKDVLISINIGNKDFVPVSLSLYDDGTYELFTAYETCKPGRICTSMLKYIKSIKGKYNYDIEKILKASTNADKLSFDMNHLPEYEIHLGKDLTLKYNSLLFVVEKRKRNKYLNELLKMINVDLSKCAKPIYIS